MRLIASMIAMAWLCVPAASVAQSAASTELAPAAAAPVPAPTPTASDSARRIFALQDEIDALKDERPSPVWPIVLMGGGLTVGATGLALGLAIAIANAEVEADLQEARDRTRGAVDESEYKTYDTTACFVVGALATTLGVAGFAWLLSTLGERSKINRVIKARQRELDYLELDVRGGPRAAAATLRLRF